MSDDDRIAVALSGGADSAAAAVILKGRGFEVVTLTMRLAEHNDSAVDCAAGVARALGVEHRVVDLRSEFERLVVHPFVEAYASGLTPNPCVNCNRDMKFTLLLAEAQEIGCRYLATGHYAENTGGGERPFALKRPVDRGRDQTYVLWTLGQSTLKHVLFPLGTVTREDVAGTIREAGITCRAMSSQDICFLDGGPYADLVAGRAPGRVRPGPILDTGGNVLGEHRGLARYTVGQRKGLGLGGPGSSYVLEIRPDDNTLVVGPRERLFCREFPVAGVHFSSGARSPGTVSCQVMTRYRGAALPASLDFDRNGSGVVRYRETGPPAAPGQSAVFYQGDELLGGAVIDREC